MINQLLIDLYVSGLRVFVFTGISFVLGSVLGYLCYMSRLARILLMPLVNFMRHVSPFCWLPIVIIIWGLGETAVGIVLLSAMLFNGIVISTGLFCRISRDILDTAALDGAGAWPIFKAIELPLAIPDLIELYRVLWSVGWTTIIASEMLGVSSGMGYRLLDFRYLLQYREMLIYILVIGITGILTDYLICALARISKAHLFG
jgi:ABC-type nitrate/sulfonate/bicarbonate transport system permease component